MTADRDTTRIVRSWLRSDEHESADRVLQTVLSRLDSTQQRRSLWPPRRFAQMNNIARGAVAAAAVLVVAVVGYSLLPKSSIVGPPAASPTTAPTPTTVPTATAIPTLAMSPARSIPAGTHLVTDATLVPFTVTVPAGWEIDGGGFLSKSGSAIDGKGSGVAFTTWEITHVYANSCDWSGTLQPTNTRRVLAAAFTAQTGHTTSAATDVTLGGAPATRIELSLPADFDVSTCHGDAVRLWPDPGPDEGGGWRIRPGQTTTVYVQEFNDRVQVAFTVTGAAASASDLAELAALVQSIRFQQ